ncbi:unnamed protein product [Parnassius apollo]|uniref:(apollo) hypothetical protein n=1 Tax=Parnassius apollo TaxID=110799 RepID=A0A8S3XZI4_PARAO|nr:unnamed protein product [Parnassius apollo]
MKKELSTLLKTTSKAIDKDYKDYRHKIIENNLNTFRSMTKAYKKLTTYKYWIQGLKSKSNETKTRKDIMECATVFYKQLYTKPISCKTDVATADLQCLNDLTPVDEQEVTKHIRRLRAAKSPGPDGIQNEAIKAGSILLTSPLTHLFNKVLHTLLYKKGDPQDISNYRPISFLSSVYKLFLLSPEIDKYQPV